MSARLADRILATLKFFDLQNAPLTISQLRDFLLADPAALKNSLTEFYEITAPLPAPEEVSVAEIRNVLDTDLKDQIEFTDGFISLTGRSQIVRDNQEHEVDRQHREELIRRFVPAMKFIPFVRGAAIGGSHVLGQSKKNSDIDLFIILDPKFLWLGRILVTGYFQITGHRRHGAKIASRFCLNHYLGGAIEVTQERDLFNAMEYKRLRPEIFPQEIQKFLEKNQAWITKFFPQPHPRVYQPESQPMFQFLLEHLFKNPAGRGLNWLLGKWQMARIMRGSPAVANPGELSFHSKERKYQILGKFFADIKS